MIDVQRKTLRLLQYCALALACAVPLSADARAQQPNPAALHTDPLNLDPAVRDAYLHFYNLDYDGALARFNQVLGAHQDNPMAYAYVLMVTIFRELYHQDLLDTTYYAHDSFPHLQAPRRHS